MLLCPQQENATGAAKWHFCIAGKSLLHGTTLSAQVHSWVPDVLNSELTE